MEALTCLPFPLPLLWGWRDWSFLRSWKHQGVPLRGRNSSQKVDASLWKRPAPFAWEPRWGLLRKAKLPAGGPSAPPPCPPAQDGPGPVSPSAAGSPE